MIMLPNRNWFKLVMLLIIILFIIIGCNRQNINNSDQNKNTTRTKQGKIHDSKGRLVYEGGLTKGNIKILDNEYIVWAECGGDYIPQGKGHYYGPNGLCVKGVFEKGIANGQGKLCWPSGEYAEGTFVNGKLKGKVIFRYPDGKKQYQGEWDGYCRQGSGIQYNHLDEWVAKGTYENDKLLKGRIREFWHEEFDSSELKWKHGALCFEGEVINGKKNGFGKLYNEKGHLEYEGEFKEDLFNGQGKLYKYELETIGLDPLAYEGNWVSGKRDGYGKGYYFMDGFDPVWFEGNWHKDEPVV